MNGAHHHHPLLFRERLPAPPLPTDVTLTVTQNDLTIPASFYSGGQTAIGHPLLDKNGNPIQGQGYFSVDSFESSGMDSLALNGGAGMVDFSGPVTITASHSISVGNGGTPAPRMPR